MEKKKQIKKVKKDNKPTQKYYGLFESHPVFTAIFLLIGYFIMDDILLDVTENAGAGLLMVCLLLTATVFYNCYVLGYVIGYDKTQGKDIPAFVKNKKRYAVIFFWVLTLLTITVPLYYDEIIINRMPNLDTVYYSSQVFLLVLIAPIMEELIFRYFLYDRWARKRWGILKGILVSGILFVICHPVSDLDSMVLYWAPTLLFYLVYDSFGLYGSIIAHIIFNFLAL